MPTPKIIVAVLLVAAAPTQAPATVATYTWKGEPGTVTMDDVALEMAPRQRRTEHGKETIEHLIDLHLVRKAAEAKGVLPTDGEVRKQLDAYRGAIEAQGRDPAQYLASKGISMNELADYTILTLALDRLVMQQLGMKDAGQVTNEYRELWLRDARKAAEPVTSEAALPPGIVARVAERQFTMLDLGRVLAARAKPAERNRYARQVILRRILDAEARARGIEVTAADCAATVARIRARAEAEKGGDVTFDNMLEALGTTEAELQASPVLKAQAIARRLLEERYPESEIQARLVKDADSTRARFGARRRVDVLWLRASATPSQLIPRSFETAEKEAAQLRDKLDKGTTFAMLARVHSDDPRTKLKGGEAGWHRRASTSLPDEVLAWAFAAQPGDVSNPIRVADGVCLAHVAEVEPQPDVATLRARLLEDMEEGLHRELLAQADVQLQEGE
ncbi:MAG: peptidylprolyl isomerase [Planctomycetota bacterium]